MPERKFVDVGSGYRYGFNGKENDNDVKGVGNQQDYGMRIYDPRLGKFLSVDPITKKYPELTPFQFASNTPICAIDLDGLEAFSLSFNAGYFAGIYGDERGVGGAIGRDGIAFYTYKTTKYGLGAEVGAGVTVSFFPTMGSLSNLGKESIGLTVSGGLLSTYSLGTVVSGDDFGFTGGWAFGGGASITYDFSDTKLQIVPWKEVSNFIANSTDHISTSLRKIFGITDQNKQNATQIINDFYKKSLTSLIEARKSDINKEQMALSEAIATGESYIQHYNNMGWVYKLINYSKKNIVEYTVKRNSEKVKENDAELESLNDIKIDDIIAD